MRLIIVRHGQTEGNVKKIMQGQSHGRLTREGRAQARGLGLRLKDEKIAVIYSSDLSRSVHTTREISKFHKAHVHHVKDLREMDVGIFEGRSWELFSKRMRANKIRSQFRPKGGESYLDVKRRLEKFTLKLYKKHPRSTVLLSTHGIAIRCLMSIYLGIPLEETTKLHTRNAGVLILNVGKTGARKILDEITARMD